MNLMNKVGTPGVGEKGVKNLVCILGDIHTQVRGLIFVKTITALFISVFLCTYVHQ